MAKFWLIVSLTIFVWFNASGIQGRYLKPYDYGNCKRDQYRCRNGNCISRDQWCNGRYVCSDHSDETYCKRSTDGYGRLVELNCPQSPYPYKKCEDGNRCIPAVWVCDGTLDCQDGSDEKNCGEKFIQEIPGAVATRNKTIQWLLKQRKENAGSQKWGFQVPRIAVALYLSDTKFFATGNRTGEEIAYELRIQLLANLLRDQTIEMTTSELAVYLNALLVSCINPRNFHGMDIVTMLRQRFDQQNSTNPSVLLALCNAKNKMSQADVNRLLKIEEDPHRPFWTGTKALKLMALSCINDLKQSDIIVKLPILTNLALDLKQKQFRNGSIENLHTTGLVAQALMASGYDDDDDWNLEDAVKYIISNQSSDGSFGNILNTYYILPMLHYKSLLNVSMEHCNTSAKRDEVTAINDLRNKLGSKIYVKYSLWIGDQVDIARTLQLYVVVNSTLFDIMNFAAETDPMYRFEFSMLNRKPYVYQVSNIQDDPESNKFWFLYKTDKFRTDLTAIHSSPVDIIPKDKEEFVLWYRSKDIKQIPFDISNTTFWNEKYTSFYDTTFSYM